MSTMNVSLPDDLKAFVDEQVSTCGYDSSSEYLCELIRKEADVQHLRALLLEGAASPMSTVADAAFFEEVRAHIRQAGE